MYVGDLTGMTFDRLTAIEPIPGSADQPSRLQWVCRCSCGTITYVRASHLKRSNGTKSCGCLSREIASKHRKLLNHTKRKHSLTDTTWRSLWTSHVSGAKARNLEWLGFDDYVQWLTEQPACWYCGVAPSERVARYGEPVLAHGIDRIDSSMGYVPGNIRTACMHCNRAKMDASTEDFLAMCRRVVGLHGK